MLAAWVTETSDDHGDLPAMDYWDTLQRDLRAGKVPRISVYPAARKLVPEAG